MQTKPVIAIIGGGAAGMMAAATLLEKNIDAEIHLFEKNSQLGAKVIISGGGRCNVTTGITSKKELINRYIRGSEFLAKHVLKVFGPKKVYKRFESHGVPLKIEDDMRVFPISNNGKDVVAVFEKLFHEHGLTIHYGEPVEQINLRHGVVVCKNGCPREKNYLLVTNKSMYQADYVILTTGGNAYSHTGSTGDGYSFAQKCGHTITRLGPGLNSFKTKETWCHGISGLSLEKAELKAKLEDGTFVTETGPILFTHFGLSGPATFAFSSHVAFEKVSEKQPLQIQITPDITKNFEYWNKTLISMADQHSKKEIRNVLSQLLPKRFAETILMVADIKPFEQAAHLSKDDRKKLAHLLSGKLTLNLIQRRPGDEFVTAGGISLDEVNAKTMESHLCTGLYFAGEILDIDGVTGGFNLQNSWATGYVVGSSITETIKK